MKAAFSESCAASAVGPQFNRLFQHVFLVAKEIRTNTTIGACPVSIASAAVSLAKSIFPRPLPEANILLLGAGDTIQLVLRYLKNESCRLLTIANRHVENATELAKTYSTDLISFNELAPALADADILISATSSATPIVTKSMLGVRTKPIVIVDIAVPRDVDTEVAEVDQVILRSIDDLKNTIQQHLQGREHAAEKAQDVIRKRSHDFMTWLNSLDAIALTISAYRKQIEELCQAELDKAHRQLQRGDAPSDVLSHFAYTLTNKLLHHPSVQLRQAGLEGRFDMLEWAQQLFVVPDIKSSYV
jgi:glutamyl-tRNA reductase